MVLSKLWLVQATSNQSPAVAFPAPGYGHFLRAAWLRRGDDGLSFLVRHDAPYKNPLLHSDRKSIDSATDTCNTAPRITERVFRLMNPSAMPAPIAPNVSGIGLP